MPTMARKAPAGNRKVARPGWVRRNWITAAQTTAKVKSRDAAERIAPRSRSRDLVAALRVLQAVLDAVHQDRSLLDGERRSTSPTDSSP